MVERLLFEDDAQIRLLLRAENSKRLTERMNTLWEFWRVSPENTEIRNRVRGIAGDALIPRFGMSQKQYDLLSEECSHIVHSAGNVRMNLPIDSAREFALSSVRNIFDLAEASMKRGELEKIEFISTVGVAGNMPGALPETWVASKREFHNTYEQAKAEAEDLIEKELEGGLPATVHRPSMVIGDSRDGKILHFQIFYHICEFLSGRRTRGLVPNLIGHFLDIVPVDFVAKAVAWSSNRKETSGKIFHLCSGPELAIDLMDLMKCVRKIFEHRGNQLPRKKIIPRGIFKSAIPVFSMFASSKERKAMKALPFLFDYLGEQQHFENIQTRTLLKKNGISIPNIDSLLEKVLRYYVGSPLFCPRNRAKKKYL